MPFTRRRVLTAGFSRGRKIPELGEATAAYRHELAGRINDLYLKQIFEYGFFHADPHPGNIAAIIIGSSIIMQIHIGPSVNGVPLLGVGGYIIALVLGLWLIWSILRSGRL